MPETIVPGCDGLQKWRWVNVMKDLEEQGGFPGVLIDPLSVRGGSCGGQTKDGTRFFVTWAKDKYLLLTVQHEEQPLVEAFAKVVGYQPFCKYIDENGLLTFEWDKRNPEIRFAELLKGEKRELRRI